MVTFGSATWRKVSPSSARRTVCRTARADCAYAAPAWACGARRRLAAVGAIQSTLQLRHPRQQHRDGLLERRVPGPKPRILLRQRRRGGGLMGGSSAGSVLGRSHGQVDSYAESRVNSFLEGATWAVT